MDRKTYREISDRIDKLSKYLNGGKGSGNWGHLGRPGEVGGSTSKGEEIADVTQHMANTAQANIDKAIKEEPQTTADLKEVFEQNGVSFYGLEFRVKTKTSLARKIASDMKAFGLENTNENIQKTAARINDNLRYTALCSEDKYKAQYDGVMNSLKEKGYEVVKVKNTMKDENAMYRGVNTQLKNKNGYTFELQFHTPESQKIKSQNHVDYERWRKDSSPEKLKEILGDRMVKRYEGMKMPKGAEGIESFEKNA